MMLLKQTKQLSLLAVALLLFGPLCAQTMQLTLDEAIILGKQKSFEAFKAKNSFLSSALDYQTSLKLLFPKATLWSTPASYSRSIAEQWDSNDQQYKPYEVQSLNSSGGLSLIQNVAKTGGVITMNSSLYRYKTFKEEGDDYTAYISNPVTLTYSQDLAGVNTFKWRIKIDSVSYQQARKQYLEDVETTKIKAISLFFNLLNAEMNSKIAELNKNNADTLFFFGKKKLEIGAISRDNYLKLQLRKVNAGISLESCLLALQEARLAMNNFLELPRETKIQCHVPSRIPIFEIPADQALTKAFDNNPDMVALENNLLAAERSVKAAKAERFSANISATVGLNQNPFRLSTGGIPNGALPRRRLTGSWWKRVPEKSATPLAWRLSIWSTASI
jgi:outer membrane protein TolC